MSKRLTIIVGLVAALVGSVYLGKIATQYRMLDTVDAAAMNYPQNVD